MRTENNEAEEMALRENTSIHGMLLDIQIPVLDGVTMLGHMHDRCRYIPAIIMSEELNSKKMIEAVEQGANDYLLKSISLNLLAKNINRSLERPARQAQ